MQIYHVFQFKTEQTWQFKFDWGADVVRFGLNIRLSIRMASVNIAYLLLILNLKRGILFPWSFSVSFFKLIEQNSGVYIQNPVRYLRWRFSSLSRFIGYVITDTGKKSYSFVSSGKYTNRMDRISKHGRAYGKVKRMD